MIAQLVRIACLLSMFVALGACGGGGGGSRNDAGDAGDDSGADERETLPRLVAGSDLGLHLISPTSGALEETIYGNQLDGFRLVEAVRPMDGGSTVRTYVRHAVVYADLEEGVLRRVDLQPEASATPRRVSAASGLRELCDAALLVHPEDPEQSWYLYVTPDGLEGGCADAEGDTSLYAVQIGWDATAEPVALPRSSFRRGAILVGGGGTTEIVVWHPDTAAFAGDFVVYDESFTELRKLVSAGEWLDLGPHSHGLVYLRANEAVYRYRAGATELTPLSSAAANLHLARGVDALTPDGRTFFTTNEGLFQAHPDRAAEHLVAGSGIHFAAATPDWVVYDDRGELYSFSLSGESEPVPLGVGDLVEVHGAWRGWTVVTTTADDTLHCLSLDGEETRTYDNKQVLGRALMPEVAETGLEQVLLVIDHGGNDGVGGHPLYALDAASCELGESLGNLPSEVVLAGFYGLGRQLLGWALSVSDDEGSVGTLYVDIDKEDSLRDLNELGADSQPVEFLHVQ